MISGLHSNNYEDRLKRLRMLSLKDRRIQFNMVQTFKIVHEIVEDRGERVTRLSVDPWNIKSKLFNTELKKRFFSDRLVQQWNDLSKEIKNVKSVGSFKSQYTQWKLHQSEDEKKRKLKEKWMYQTGRSERCIYSIPFNGAFDSKLQIKQVK